MLTKTELAIQHFVLQSLVSCEGHEDDETFDRTALSEEVNCALGYLHERFMTFNGLGTSLKGDFVQVKPNFCFNDYKGRNYFNSDNVEEMSGYTEIFFKVFETFF